MSVHEVTVDVAAPPSVVYDLLSDIARMPDWSPEVIRCGWIRGADGPRSGARFRGWSRKGWRRWSTISTISAADRPDMFEWRVSFVGMPVATWRYTFERNDGAGTTVTEAVVDQRGAVLRRLSPLITGSSDRRVRNDETMHTTLDRLKHAAEASYSTN